MRNARSTSTSAANHMSPLLSVGVKAMREGMRRKLYTIRHTMSVSQHQRLVLRGSRALLRWKMRPVMLCRRCSSSKSGMSGGLPNTLVRNEGWLSRVLGADPGITSSASITLPRCVFPSMASSFSMSILSGWLLRGAGRLRIIWARSTILSFEVLRDAADVRGCGGWGSAGSAPGPRGRSLSAGAPAPGNTASKIPVSSSGLLSSMGTTLASPMIGGPQSADGSSQPFPGRARPSVL
mmetsp:Transcript_53239/g.169056  ORF Transcript_53239/g.169056 Transcript_53239/m.169056 type:complete len:237 (+) Transcript_53239:1991-2701(+)